MKPIRVDAEHSYEVIFAPASHDTLTPALVDATQLAIIVPKDLRNLADDLKGKLQSTSNSLHTHIFTVGEGESQKNISTVIECWNFLAAHNFKRTDAIVGLGGGATTDLAGFVAATWLRGIKWGAIPTSLAGMVDAAVGGKTGINTDAGKNLVGSFYSPSVVLIDVKYLNSLPALELRSGMAEVIKTGFIADQEILTLIETKSDFLDPESATIKELIYRSIAVKAEVVSKDLKESYLRESLNYGHTLAHAIERIEKYAWRHGDAVAVGLAFIAYLSEMTGVSSATVRQRHLDILQLAGLPTSYRADAWPELLGAMQNDKKARGTGLRFVAVNDKYEVLRLEGLTDDVLRGAYERISS